MAETGVTSEAVSALWQWAVDLLKLNGEQVPALEMVSGDASFRRYYRLSGPQHASVIAVHAPPDKENNEAFVAVQSLLHRNGVRVPALLGWQREQGFLLQEDFGGQLLLPLLINAQQADHYYALAINSVLQMQSVPVAVGQLPAYDAARLRQEMALFPEWFVEQLLGYRLNDSERTMLETVFTTLCDSAEAQLQALVHRDFHSRNIMVLDDGELGLIDFQDAVLGPVTYDLVSLLRDCYVSWPQDKVEFWALQYYQQARDAGLMLGSADEFLRQFDLMGVQRHLKVLGIFARLHLRDGKAAYLDDLPLVIAYTLGIAEKYPELEAFCSWFRSVLLPLAEKQSWYKDVSL